jgi:hypothetical protein
MVPALEKLVKECWLTTAGPIPLLLIIPAELTSKLPLIGGEQPLATVLLITVFVEGHVDWAFTMPSLKTRRIVNKSNALTRE